MTYAEFEKEWLSDSPTVHAHTSGSTGAPKDISLLKADMVASARATNAFFGVNADSMLMIPLSCDYIAGKMMAVRSYVAGCRLVVIDPKNDFEIGESTPLSALRYSQFATVNYCETSDAQSSAKDDSPQTPPISLISIVPSQADALISHPQWARKIGAVIIGGAPISFEKRQALVQAGYRAFCSYGMTETCSHVALAPVTDQDDLVFVAMPGISFSTDDRECLIVDAPMMSVRQVVTNDIVELIDNRSFRWLGRADNVINSGGIKIFPEALEKEIAKILPLNFYIVGIPDEKWGQALQIVIERPRPVASASYCLNSNSPSLDPQQSSSTSLNSSLESESSPFLNSLQSSSTSFDSPQSSSISPDFPQSSSISFDSRLDDDLSGEEAIKNLLKSHLDHKFVPKSVHFVQNLPRTDNGKLRRIAYIQ